MTEQLIQNTMFRGRGTNSVSLAHTVCLLCVGGAACVSWHSYMRQSTLT